MATHSEFLWKTPWTEEPNGLQSMGLQRVGQDGVIGHSTWLSSIPFFFIHSTADEHLGCFHVLAIVNTAAMYSSQYLNETGDGSTSALAWTKLCTIC